MNDTTVVSGLLDQRGRTHGSFDDNARVAQSIRLLFRSELGWACMSAVQREALDMIACKLSRILSGQPGHQDHWDDVAGYATLVSQRCEPISTTDVSAQFDAEFMARTAKENLLDDEVRTSTFGPLQPPPTRSGLAGVAWAAPSLEELSRCAKQGA